MSPRKVQASLPGPQRLLLARPGVKGDRLEESRGAGSPGAYSDLFGWQIDADNPMNYGIVQRDGNVSADGAGIGGGVGQGPRVMAVT